MRSHQAGMTRRVVAAMAMLLAVGLLVLGAPRSALADAPTLGQNATLLGLKVKLALLEKLGIDALHVKVDVVEGKAVLSGTVKKRETSELAEGIAKSVTGIGAVENDVKLAEYERSGDKSHVAVTETERELSDALLDARVRVKLIEMLGADGFRIGTQAAGSTVTLEFPKDLPQPRRDEAVRVTKLLNGVARVLTVEKKS